MYSPVRRYMYCIVDTCIDYLSMRSVRAVDVMSGFPSALGRGKGLSWPTDRWGQQPLFMRVLLWSGRSQSSDHHQAFRPGQPSIFEGRLRASASRSPSCPRRGGWSSSRRTVTYADVMVVVDTFPSASPDFFAPRLHPHFASNDEMPARTALRMAWVLCTHLDQDGSRLATMH